MRSFRLLMWFSLGLFLGGFWSYSHAAVPEVWTGKRTNPGSVYLRGPNNLPFNVDTGRYTSIVPAGNGDVSLAGQYRAKVGTAGMVIDAARDLPVAKIAKVASKAARAFPVIALGISLGEYFFDEDLMQWAKPGDDGKRYSGSWFSGGNFSNLSGREAVCTQWATSHASVYGYQFDGLRSCYEYAPNLLRMSYWRNQGGYQYQVGEFNIATFTQGAPTGVTPVSESELEEAFFQGIPMSDMSPELVKRIMESGFEDDVHAEAGELETSGPSSLDGGTKTTTETTSEGTRTKTEQTTYNISYAGDTVTIVSSTVTNITNPDGSTETGTSEETGGDPKEQDEQYSLDYTNSTLGEVPDFYEHRYPDGIAGAWEARRVEFEQTSLFSLVNRLTGAPSGGGTCPAWTIDLSGLQMGSHSLEPPCFVWDFVKAALILTALFVARRLVFGG